MKDPFLDDLQPQAIDKSDPLESKIQSDAVAWAGGRGYWARKFSSPANRSVPDYLFARWEFRDKFFVEFKRLGKTNTDAQEEEQEKMREAGWEGTMCDSVEKFKAYVLAREANARS